MPLFHRLRGTGKVVVAVRKGFAHEDYRNPDLIPDEWIQL